MWTGMLVANLGMVVVGWAIFRKRTGLAKSYVRVFAASVLLLWSAVATLGTLSDARAQMDQRGTLFLQKMIENGKRQQQEMQALDEKFRSVDLSGILDASHLTDQRLIAESRTKVEVMRALIGLRGETLRRMFSESAELIKTADISEADRRSALKGMNEKAPATSGLYTELDRVQLATLAAISDLLDFAEANVGKAVAKNGQLLFSSKPALDEYRRLFARAQAAAEEETRVTKSIPAATAKAREELRNAEEAARK
jgi:hypothetical protein